MLSDKNVTTGLQGFVERPLAHAKQACGIGLPVCTSKFLKTFLAHCADLPNWIPDKYRRRQFFNQARRHLIKYRRKE